MLFIVNSLLNVLTKVSAEALVYPECCRLVFRQQHASQGHKSLTDVPNPQTFLGNLQSSSPVLFFKKKFFNAMHE